jgi:deoxyribonuclease V
MSSSPASPASSRAAAPQLACVDVHYDDTVAISGCLLFTDWGAAYPTARLLATTPLAAPYRPGELYLRELPPLLAVLARATMPLAAIVVDGYVWLGAAHPGLGARLYDALDQRIPIIGVAKTAWAAEPAPGGHPHRIVSVTRGQSARPLFVTAAGVDVADAAAQVARMHGPHRLPTLLKAVDRLVRDGA